jgi:trimethylamine:corrinoid methyltransferase-like protein
MLKIKDCEVIEKQVYRLLNEIGIKIENDEVQEICIAKGCSAGSDHRIKIPREIIDEMVGFQKITQESYEHDLDLVQTCGPDWAHHLMWTGEKDRFRKDYAEKFLMQAFDCGPTVYYDFDNSRVMPVNGDVFDRMMKFAEATPEIGYISGWYRQDLPPKIERLDSLIHGLKITTKVDGIEAIYPEVIKYLKEASVIYYDDSDSSAFLAGSECMTMPLVLEKRSAQDILERKKSGVHRYHVASMPTLGVSTPVTLADAAILAAAEILGGMAICWCVDPESDISGRMICLTVDMRNGNSTTFGPLQTQYNNAVRQLFNEYWGGHCMVEVLFSPTARKPGLQAVFENYYGTTCRRLWDNNPDIPYAGMGTLHNGGMGSPVQFILDMEIRKAEYQYCRNLVVEEEALCIDEIFEVTAAGGNFFGTEHTVEHIHDVWESPLFLSADPFEGEWKGDEASILKTCDDMWKRNLEKWEPPAQSPEKMAALDDLLSRAKKEFHID